MFGEVFDQIFGQVCGQGLFCKNVVYSSTGTEKYRITVLFTIYDLESKKIQNSILGTT